MGQRPSGGVYDEDWFGDMRVDVRGLRIRVGSDL